MPLLAEARLLEDFGSFSVTAFGSTLTLMSRNELIENRHKDKHYSALRERLKQEDAAAVAKLTPAERLQAALDLSDFCLMLAAKTREADAQRSITKGRRGAR